MKIRIENSKKKTSLLCGFVLENSTKVLGLGKIDAKTASIIDQSIKDMEGKLGKLNIIPLSEKNSIQRILLAGLGKKEDLTRDTIRAVSGKIAQKARELKLKEFSIIAPPSFVTDTISSVSQIVEGSKMALYKFDNFKSEKSEESPDLTIIVSKSNKIVKAIKNAEIIANSAIFTKGLANLPPNECTPNTLANFAKIISKNNKLKCKVISEPELKKRGFGGISAVGQGSKNRPKLIVLEYNNGPRNEKPIVLVGKAVTFDTGGISLKPGDKMDEMKFDKCGGCTVIGIMKAVSELKLPTNVIGIVPSVENMPGGESYRPGDIIKLYSGKTAEILNTDAEGRLILADALSYGEKFYSPKAIIDFATLTGACIVALGTNVAGMVSNNEKLTKKIYDASSRTTEEVWELPLNQDYIDMIKSEVADMKNVGIGRSAGTITAAAFLRNSIENTPWVHLDIAGVAWTQTSTKEKSYNPKGATGFGVRLILDYLQNL
ncbi:cytosol aminopeptidase family, catalytic domain protein [Candidatus Nitrosopumilus salaria BD31]|uniref:Probable cytosol aminopeptidase n=1 Tax=Candidatus Nitrosopumilus salarius BD31 TaxID=859350 RepID=I3D1G2_9ARCH|nr:leucyl aminopeptidase [Candidatus Nitrosopumilus salaria]EIJ65555.1 cytosol aminopeptidase family, catalytic domain protein [Candidatus Nitrosopumilus salaria BD31]